ncbi:MAG: [Fe-Fe] hydrogenase large subunit C-terminal domain-containing protein [Patescibacteria group bacterium]
MTDQLPVKPKTEPEILIDLLKKNQPLVAMLAPSFPIVYEFANIVGKLKRLGFSYVVEVTAGAMHTNAAAIELLKNNPQARVITSPCASFVRMIRTKYPHLEKYLGFAADSPMVATARIVKKKYPNHKPVFIGPCNAKKLEANEDYPELEILSVTYKQMQTVFDHFQLQDDPTDEQAKLDLEETHTRLYPISGGLAQSSAVKDLLADEEIEVVSGWQNCEQALKRFETSDRIRLLDILFCEGGCINGPGINSPLSLAERREKIVQFWELGNKQPIPIVELNKATQFKKIFPAIRKALTGLFHF